jgi:hypothetical protein
MWVKREEESHLGIQKSRNGIYEYLLAIYGKSQCLTGKSDVNGFSIAMLNYPRVYNMCFCFAFS